MGAERLPTRFLRRLRARELSPSTVSLHLGTNLAARALGASHDTSVARTWNLERVSADALRGRIQGAHVVIPSLTDPALAPAGEHVVMVQGPAARESGEMPHDDRRIAEDLLSYAEDVLPGLRSHITFIEPADDEQAGTHPQVHRMGPIYGWMNSPAQTGLRRLAPTTPLSGLLVAGQWTQPSHALTP